MKNIIFIAPPSAGKGTYSDILSNNYGYEHISTGELLRKEVEKNTELGNKISTIMSSGTLISDDLVLEILENRIKEVGNKCIILDGVPRNINQVEPVLRMFNTYTTNDYVVIYLDVTFDKAMKRTLGRVSCPKCKKGYNSLIDEFKPKVDNICDECGSTLISRADDNEETFKVRFNTYMNETKPLLDYFKDINKLVTIDANGLPDVSQIERVIK